MTISSLCSLQLGNAIVEMILPYQLTTSVLCSTDRGGEHFDDIGSHENADAIACTDVWEGNNED